MKLTKDMARIIGAEVDESNMGEEEREYRVGLEDYEDEDVGGVGD